MRILIYCEHLRTLPEVCDSRSASVGVKHSGYVSTCQHMSAHVSIPDRRMRYSASGGVKPSAYVSICQHMSAYVSTCQHTSAYLTEVCDIRHQTALSPRLSSSQVLANNPRHQRATRLEQRHAASAPAQPAYTNILVYECIAYTNI